MIAKIYNLIFFPGLLIHELAHLGAILLTCNRIWRMDYEFLHGQILFLVRTRNRVECFFITFAPLLVLLGIISLALVTWAPIWIGLALYMLAGYKYTLPSKTDWKTLGEYKTPAEKARLDREALEECRKEWFPVED